MELLIQKQLKAGRQDVLDAALGQLHQAEFLEFDTLLQTIEALSETCRYEHDGVWYDVLLIAAPALAWTRFSIPHGEIRPEIVQDFGVNLAAHVLAPGVRYFVAPQLYSLDQLPPSHVETAQLTRELAQTLFGDKDYRAVTSEQEALPFLADTRYLLAAVAVPEGLPLFGWQAEQNPVVAEALREGALGAWQEKNLLHFSHILPGCHVDLLLPGAFFATCRKADMEIRPALIKAAVNFITQTLDVDAADLRAVVAPFGELSQHELASEYRIGFSRRNSRDLLYGVVWPLYAQEESEEENAMPTLGASFLSSSSKNPLETIMQLLKEEGVLCDCVHQERFPLEYCEDCGAPMFADQGGELVHAEMPEEDLPEVLQLH